MAPLKVLDVSDAVLGRRSLRYGAVVDPTMPLTGARTVRTAPGSVRAMSGNCSVVS